MGKLHNFLKKPRNMYFSIIGMMTIVMSLISVTFAYYIPSSHNLIAQVNVHNIANVLKSDDLENGDLFLKPYEKRTIKMWVVSNNAIETRYNIVYERKGNIDIHVPYLPNNLIGAHDVHEITIEVQNNDAEDSWIHFSLINGYKNQANDLENKEILAVR